MTLAAFHLCYSLWTLSVLPIALLAPIPGLSTPGWTSLQHPGWEHALLQLQALFGLPGTTSMPWKLSEGLMPKSQSDSLPVELRQEDFKRWRRGHWLRKSVDQFPTHPIEIAAEVGDGEGGEKNKALISIAGGLQAISRQKGGFGFRFGKK